MLFFPNRLIFLRFFARWRRHPVEYLMRELDSGEYDAELKAAAGPVAPAAPPRQFVNGTPFDMEDWGKR
jgi:hypothetical protein